MATGNLTAAQQQALDLAFKRSLRQHGMNQDLPVSISAALAPYTTEARDFYVDGTYGSDLADGSAVAPFKTIGRAAREIIIGNHFDVRIYLKAGTYAENVKIQALTAYSANIQIIGAEYTRVTPTTGSATGTATSFSTSTHKLLVSGAGWTASDFKGCLLRFTSGSLSASTQLPFPIYDNTATELEIPALDSSIATGAAGATFEIFKPAATIQFPATPTTGFKYPIESSVLGNLGRNGLVIQNVIMDGTNSLACAAVSGSISFQGCIFQNTTNHTSGIVNSFSPGAIMSIRNCYVKAPRITSGWFWAGLFFRNSVFVTDTGHQFQIDYPGAYIALQKMCYFETTNPSVGPAIFSLKSGHTTIYSTEEMVVKNCGHFIKAEGGNNNLTFTGRVNITQSTSAAVAGGAIWFTEGGAYAGGGNRLYMNNVNVVSCAGPFLTMETFHNSVGIANGTVSNCGDTAFKMSNSSTTGLSGSFNVLVVYNTTMSGNAADFSIDGVATFSKVTALAATNGVTTDSTLFNRLVVKA